MNFFRHENHNPYYNLALEEHLFCKDDSEPLFMLWQNSPSVILGKNQDIYAETNLSYITQAGVLPARRMTGGGAVYHDLGNVNYTFIVPQRTGQAGYDFKTLAAPVARALESLGVKTEQSGRNDLLIDGKKFSGSAQYVGKTKVFHHGTLMFSTDPEEMRKCLTPNEEKLSAHGVKSVKSRVTTIKPYLSNDDINDFIDRLYHCVKEEFGGKDITLSDEDIKATEQLRDTKYATDAWIYRTNRKYDYIFTKSFSGCGIITIGLNVSDAVISSCGITGDFFGSGSVSDIEKCLENAPFSAPGIKKTIKDVEIGYYFNNLTEERFMELFWFIGELRTFLNCPANTCNDQSATKR